MVPSAERLVVVSLRLASSTAWMLSRSADRLMTLHDTTTVSGGTFGSATTSPDSSFRHPISKTMITIQANRTTPTTRSRFDAKVHGMRNAEDDPYSGR